MKNIGFGHSLAAFAMAACLTAHPAFASNEFQLDVVKKKLRATPAAEMPAKAAQLVTQAGPDAREVTTETVVTAAADLRPVAVIAVVSAIARDNPTLAAMAAAKAAMLQPKQAASIARAAAGAAPGQAGKIVYAVCKAVPTKYSVVATAVAQVVPSATKEILEAVCTAVPALKAFVEQASKTAKENWTVVAIMGEIESLVQATALSARTTPERIITSATPASAMPVFASLPPPTVGPPFTLPGGSPTEINRTNTAEIPPGGGRDYSGP